MRKADLTDHELELLLSQTEEAQEDGGRNPQHRNESLDKEQLARIAHTITSLQHEVFALKIRVNGLEKQLAEKQGIPLDPSKGEKEGAPTADLSPPADTPSLPPSRKDKHKSRSLFSRRKD